MSTAANTTERNVISGLIEMSIAPRPVMIAGVLAIAASASGANTVTCSAQPKSRCTIRLTTSRTTKSTSAKAK